MIIIDKCRDFISQYEDSTIRNDQADPIHGKHKYMIKLQSIANRSMKIIEIDMSDLSEHFSQTRDSAFVERIRTNSVRY